MLVQVARGSEPFGQAAPRRSLEIKRRLLGCGAFSFLFPLAFFGEQLPAEFLGQGGVIDQPEQLPLEELPHALAGAPPQVELQEQRANEALDKVGGRLLGDFRPASVRSPGGI